MRRGAQEAADRLGVTLQVQAAEREIDVEKQMQIVENLLQTGIQALCITPSGSREIVSALVKAKDAKVPIVIVDTRLDAKAAADAGVQPQTFVGSDNYEGGKLAGDYVVKVDRRQGARRHPRRHSRPRDRRFAAARLPRRRQPAPGITIVASQPANWERDQGFNVFQNMLQAHPDIDSVFAAQRPDGARRDRSDRRRGQDRQDPRHRLRRARRCEEGDRGGNDGGVGGAVSVRDGQRRGGERGQGDRRRERCRPTSW